MGGNTVFKNKNNKTPTDSLNSRREKLEKQVMNWKAKLKLYIITGSITIYH